MSALEDHIFKTSPYNNPNRHKRFYGTNGWFHGLLLDCSKSSKYRNNSWAEREALKSSPIVVEEKDDLIKSMCPVLVVFFSRATEENRRKYVVGRTVEP